MQRYERRLLAYISRITNVPGADAEDILQEVFIKAYENLNDFDRDLKFSSWIYRITYNHTISYYRKNKNNLSTISAEESQELLMKMSSDKGIEEVVHQKMLGEKLRFLLLQIDKKYRDVMILRFLEEKDYEEISVILRKPVNTIGVLLSRAKEQMKKILIKNHVTLSTHE